MYVELKGSSQATKSITLPLEEYQSMLDEMKKLKEDNSMLCRGANVINVLKVDSLLRIIYTSSYPDYYNTPVSYRKVSFSEEFSDDVVEKFKNEVKELIESKDKQELEYQQEIETKALIMRNLQNTLEEKDNKISELENKKGLGFIMFMVGCFVGGMLMSMQ